MGTYRVGPNESCVSANDKSREQPGHPKRHVTFAMAERKPAYPAHAPDMHQDEDKDDKLLVTLGSPKTTFKWKRKGSAIWQDPTAFLQQKVSRDSRERAEDTSILGRKAESEALNNIISKLSEERNLRDLHLKHYHMKTAQFKNRTTHLDIPGQIYDLYQHVVKICSFCNTVKPRPERSRVSGLRAEEFGEPHLSGPWFDKDWRQNLRISDCFGWSHITFGSLSMQKYLSIGSYCKPSQVEGHFSRQSSRNTTHSNLRSRSRVTCGLAMSKRAILDRCAV